MPNYLWSFLQMSLNNILFWSFLLQMSLNNILFYSIIVLRKVDAYMVVIKQGHIFVFIQL
ncbi:hypothetical protein HMPREF3183_00935 [Peptostreptococcus anaerobius]|uniref:Uncharacterized protein n=1 Tax=Peptostreptococcus anaerobius TaxID=1261 RepID=A0A135YLN7_9FIRM|nr:hypothetical protein HMPREF9998_01882 [Peptostreptococcus anaerobius VPI 4330 = DSM 2949]KXB71487.1 hypothetical protein HMPREF3183_00935 [Peptostreptococcus anaerobius]KXI10296.1 hypothetical protein HMPREF3195_01882 [Peptostreptococcus anaerobius]